MKARLTLLNIRLAFDIADKGFVGLTWFLSSALLHAILVHYQSLMAKS